MALYIDLNTNDIAVDRELADRVPYDLVTYYMALPLAQENNQVSVVMAHPQNRAALQMLQELLQAEIVPLQATSQAIQATLSQLYPPPMPLANRIVAWSDTSARATAVHETATFWHQALAAEGMEMLPVNGHSLVEVLHTLQSGQYTLSVIPMPPLAELPQLFSQLTTPFVLVRGPFRSIRNILVVLRGFASDKQALEWIIPLVRHQESAVTLLPLANSPLYDNSHHHNGRLPDQHLKLCQQHLSDAGIPIHLKLRQGEASQQIITELSQGEYDLLVITAEAKGDYVCSILAALDESQVHPNLPVFILKPPNPLPRRQQKNL